MSGISLEFRQVGKDYGSGSVLENFNLVIPKERIVTIIGPSGCGKTTILKMINRLVEPESGTILLEGNDISKLNPVDLRRNIGYVIQQIGLFPHMTIEENISIVPRLKGTEKKKLIKRTEELLELIGLEPGLFRKRYPHELSGGQQQRIGVARALAADPSIVLMDEPFSALDPISRIQLQKELITLNQQVKKTIVFVTHDIDEALKIADQIVLLRDGKIVQEGAPEQLLNNPSCEFVREFLGRERFRAAETARTAAKTVASIMVDVKPIQSGVNLTEAVDFIQENKTDGLVVTNRDQKYLGVISIEEISRHILNGNGKKVEDVIHKEAPYINEHTPIEEVFALLKNNRIVPVIDSAHRLLGAVTQASLIESLGTKFHREEVTV